MCLVPYGPSPPPIQPNERAAKIADYFRVVIILHMVSVLPTLLLLYSTPLHHHTPLQLQLQLVIVHMQLPFLCTREPHS
jgi:hypothetical protein